MVNSNLPVGSLSEMLTVISNMPMYSAGTLGPISQLQLRLTLTPIGWMGLCGLLVIFNSVKGGTEFDSRMNQSINLIPVINN